MKKSVPYQNPTDASLSKEMTNNKVFGTPYVQQAMKKYPVPKKNVGSNINPSKMPKPVKKMTPDALAKRKRSTVSNAASKTMGGLISK